MLRRLWFKSDETPGEENPADDEFETLTHRVYRGPERPGPHPIVVGLHGFGSDERQLQSLVPLPRSGSLANYVGVRGPWAVTGGGRAWFPLVGDTIAELGPADHQLDETVELVIGTIERLRQRLNVGDEGVWLIGYSQGAPVALETLWSHPDLITGIVVAAGGFARPSTGPDPDLRAKHVLVAGSDTDRFVSVADYSRTVNRLRSAGALVEQVNESVPHVISTTQATAIDHYIERHIR